MEPYLSNLQNKIPNVSTLNVMHLYINKNHTHVDCNSQQPKLRHVPTIEVNQSNNSSTDRK
jgi:hypothetical protein